MGHGQFPEAIAIEIASTNCCEQRKKLVATGDDPFEHRLFDNAIWAAQKEALHGVAFQCVPRLAAISMSPKPSPLTSPALWITMPENLNSSIRLRQQNRQPNPRDPFEWVWTKGCPSPPSLQNLYPLALIWATKKGKRNIH